MNPKALFIILTMLIMLFALIVVWGDTRAEPKMPTLPPPWIESLGSRFSEPLGVDDLKLTTPGDCRRQFVQGTFRLQTGVTCRLFVKDSSARQRTLTLRFASGPGASVAVDHASEARLDGTQ